MATTETGEETTTGQPALKRVMGPGLLLLFIVGDVLGTGIYALTGTVAAEVGGVVWLPFLIAFLVALITAFSYLELVTKYPQAAGAALYTHKAFGIHFLTFIVAFAVMSSGITSASTAARAFSENAAEVFEVDIDGWGITFIGLGFMALVAAVNLRGVGESVKSNVVLTCVELSGLLIVIGVGAWALFGGDGDFGRVTEFDTGDKGVLAGVIAATGLAFFAMVGFEDSVNMAEECKEPRRIFPKVLLTGLGITGLIYVLVSISAIALVPADQLEQPRHPAAAARRRGGRAGLPARPLRRHHHVRRRQHRADQHADGEPAALRPGAGAGPAAAARPGAAGPPHAVDGDPLHDPARVRPDHLRRRGPRARRDDGAAAAGASSRSSTSPSWCCAGTRWTPTTSAPRRSCRWSGRWPAVSSPRRSRAGRRSSTSIAGVLLAIGVVLWAVTVAVNKRTGAGPARLDPVHLAGDEPPHGPRN